MRAKSLAQKFYVTNFAILQAFFQEITGVNRTKEAYLPARLEHPRAIPEDTDDSNFSHVLFCFRLFVRLLSVYLAIFLE